VSTLRRAQREVTRQRLEEAALAVFAEAGFSSATIDQIAARADVSRATFYFHFPSKVDVVAALLAERRPAVAEFYSRLDEAVATRRLENVEAWIKDALADFDKNATLMSATHQIAAADPEHLARLGAGFRHIAHMPKLTSACPPEHQAALEFRLNLMVALLDRTWTRLKSPDLDPVLPPQDVRRTLAEIFMATLSYFGNGSA